MTNSFILSSGIIFIFVSPVHPRDIYLDNPASFPKDFCHLPLNFGLQGSIKFVEECENLDIYNSLPIPGPPIQKYGIHPVVCCPKTSNKSTIYFPTDDEYPSFEEPFPERNSESVGNSDRNLAKISEEDCSTYTQFWGNSTQCVNLKDCPGIFHQPFNPSPTKNPADAKLCGWDGEEKSVKICCPQSLVQSKTARLAIEPRFSGYQCKDKVEECQSWKNNDGCRTDMDFAIDQDYNVSSSLMFDFMMGSCMDTCERCGGKGCRDEHPDCGAWARRGFCVTKSTFMVHTCRESCGVCGFLSTDDNRDQVVGKSAKNSYTDFTSPTFDCGRYKKMSTRQSQQDDDPIFIRKTFPAVLAGLSTFLNIPPAVDIFPVSSISSSGRSDSAYVIPNFDRLKFCGSTLISDRWVLTAAHCSDDFNRLTYKHPRKVKLAIIRDDKSTKETVEIKRVYLHPKYSYPSLYNDIALLELGRRVQYDWEQYGDSPMCLDRDGYNDGKFATFQGYGLTVDGTVGDLKEEKVTILNNTRCKEILVHNTTLKQVIRKKIERGFPNGFNKDVFCAQGISDEQGVFRSTCKGDGGGPLFVQRDDGRQKLVGIVSGGLGCGQGFPGWFTKIASFTSWIDCIRDNSNTYKNKVLIENACQYMLNTMGGETYDGAIFEDYGVGFEDKIFDL